jgi:hypothetical protein
MRASSTGLAWTVCLTGTGTHQSHCQTRLQILTSPPAGCEVARVRDENTRHLQGDWMLEAADIGIELESRNQVLSVYCRRMWYPSEFYPVSVA